MSGKQAKLKRKLDREKNKQSVAPTGSPVRVAPVVVPKPELPSTQGNNLPSPPPPGAIPSEAGRRREGSDSSILLTLVEVAKLLKVSPRTVQRLEKDHGLPGRAPLGRTVRYHREIIEKWVLTICGFTFFNRKSNAVGMLTKIKISKAHNVHAGLVVTNHAIAKFSVTKLGYPAISTVCKFKKGFHRKIFITYVQDVKSSHLAFFAEGPLTF